MARPRPVIEVLVLLILIAINTQILVLVCGGGSTVNYLPGFQGPLPFHLETGYVGVGESENVQLFYYFMKSERSPEKDPLLLWLTGGPGCSSWSGFVYEIGPLKYKIQPYNGSLPTLILNQYSWTKASSMIFVDSPVGAGFSYGRTPTASKTGDFKQSRELTQFFNKWLIDHPEFISNPIYIAGDSYSGKIVPVLVQQLANAIEDGEFPHIDLQGYIIGNPVTFPEEKNYKIPFAHGMALISDELYESLKRSCGGNYYVNVDPNNTACLNNIQAFEKSIAGVPERHILDLTCDIASLKQTTTTRRLLSQNPDIVDPIISNEPLPRIDCLEFEHSLSGLWANDPEVQKALHVHKGSIKKWVRCNDEIRYGSYAFEIESSVEYHVNLGAKGFRSLVYSGDHDMTIPFMSTQAWVRSLNYSIVDDWRSWIVDHQIAGYTRSYSNRMTFATVKGGGHTAVHYKPKECFAMFHRWANYQSM